MDRVQATGSLTMNTWSCSSSIDAWGVFPHQKLFRLWCLCGRVAPYSFGVCNASTRSCAEVLLWSLVWIRLGPLQLVPVLLLVLLLLDLSLYNYWYFRCEMEMGIFVVKWKWGWPRFGKRKKQVEKSSPIYYTVYTCYYMREINNNPRKSRLGLLAVWWQNWINNVGTHMRVRWRSRRLVVQILLSMACMVLIANQSASQPWHQRPGSCLDVKFKIPNLSHRKRILYVWSIKSRQNKKWIA